jgi:hypothetical protein
MALFEGIRNIFGGMIPTGAVGFPKTLKLADFMSAPVSVVAGKWNTLGTFTVPAQQKYRFGIGSPQYPDNQGYLYIYLRNASGAELTGKIRLVYSDANQLQKKVVYEEEESVLHASTSDRKQMKPLPEQINPIRADGRAWEDDRLIIEFYPDTSDTVSTTTSSILIPVTQY